MRIYSYKHVYIVFKITDVHAYRKPYKFELNRIYTCILHIIVRRKTKTKTNAIKTTAYTCRTTREIS